MTDDIVARLRQTHRNGCNCFGCEAADEIERLRACISEANAYMAAASAEIERIRALLGKENTE